MKKLFLKLLILLVPFFAAAIIIILLPITPNLYALAIIDKHKRLENIAAPRIVLAGGSNLAFGIDSALIQNTLDIPVINTGVHAGFGLGRILDDLAPFLSPGDILVIVPEYDLFEYVSNGNIAAYSLIFDAHQYRLLVHPPFYGFASGISHYIIKEKPRALIPRPVDTDAVNPLAYTRDGFNEYGDYVKHLNVKNKQFESEKVVTAPTLNQRSFKRFFRLIETLTERGITVLLSYPGYEEPVFTAKEAFICELDAAFRARKTVTVISRPGDYAFPRSYFYDTSYHLNAVGRELRTVRLIRDLEQYFQGKGD